MRAYSPIKEQEQEDVPLNNYEDQAASFSGCGCFKLCCFDWQRNNDGQSRSLLQEKGEHEDKWLVKKLKKLKEVSELVAGPKWKNMIRKLGKYFNTKKSKCQFQYDPESYALNFDHGVGHEDKEDGTLLGFSSRFAPPVGGEHQRTTTGL